MSPDVRIRPFAGHDLADLAPLMRQTLMMPALDEPAIARDVLLAPGFAPEHLLVAVRAGRPIGYLWAPRRDALSPVGLGWIAAFGVAPEFRRQGVARAMLEAALVAMRAEGVSELDVADIPVRYWMPGIDAAAFPVAHHWFTAELGFSVRAEVASMGIDLATAGDPGHPMIRSCRPGDYPAVKAMLVADFDIGFWAYMERSLLAQLNGDPTPAGVLCAFDGDVPVGCVHYRADRFGPLAVSPGAEGRGLGAALTRAALSAMRNAGYAQAYCLVARPEVQPFYIRLGFRVLRRFTELRRSL